MTALVEGVVVGKGVNKNVCVQWTNERRTLLKFRSIISLLAIFGLLG